MALDTAHEAQGGTRDRSARDLRDVSGDQASLIVGVSDIVVAAAVGAGQEHPSGHAARGAGCAVVKVRLRRAVLAGPPTRPAAQRRGLPRLLLPTGTKILPPFGRFAAEAVLVRSSPAAAHGP